MPRPAAKSEKPENHDGTRRQILDQTAKLLRMNGYASTSLRDIAAAMGMKAGSLYYYFASKEELAETIMTEGIERVREAVKNALAAQPADADPLDNIAVAITAHLQALHVSGDYASANIRCFTHVPDEMKLRMRKVRKRYEADWRKLIGMAREAGRLADDVDDDALRYVLFGAMNWTLEWLRRGNPSPEQLGEMFFRILFNGAARAGSKS